MDILSICNEDPNAIAIGLVIEKNDRISIFDSYTANPRCPLINTAALARLQGAVEQTSRFRWHPVPAGKLLETVETARSGLRAPG
jgi:hypothetical protein